MAVTGGDFPDLDLIRGFLEDYLRQRGLPLRRAFRCLSPGHEDKHPSMSYNRGAHNVHCFACGATYDLFGLIGLDYGLDSFSEQYRKARELFGLPATPARRRTAAGSPRAGDMMPPDNQAGGVGLPAPIVEEETVNPPDRSVELDALRRKSDGDLSCFLSRGISAETCEKYGLFQFEGRAYFPVMDGGVCSGWCARAIDDSVRPRYRNSSGPLGIWNGDILSGGGTVFVTEGVIDALCLEQMGEKAISLCGSQNVGKLLRRLESFPASCRFVACGDPDAAGQRMNAALLEGLTRLGIECSVLPLEPGSGDVAHIYLSDRGKLSDAVKRAREPAPVPRDAPALAAQGSQGLTGPTLLPISSVLDSFFSELAKRAGRAAISTGFPALDRLLDGGLYPGLYVLGAISSLGKTSFALQIADHIAGSNVHVLFVSLEQSRYELIAKSLSRFSALRDSRRGYTMRGILSAGFTEDLSVHRRMSDIIADYAPAAKSLFIAEGLGATGAEDVRRLALKHRDAHGIAPVIMVDYLQILQPDSPRATDKQNTDRAVVSLKRLSRDLDTPVIAISSFNRENYRTPVSMESFKESGAVEYSSDVLLGLQLAGAGSRGFDANAAKSREPRRLELVLLKNRSGIPYAKIPLEYHAKYSLFSEASV